MRGSTVVFPSIVHYLLALDGWCYRLFLHLFTMVTGGYYIIMRPTDM